MKKLFGILLCGIMMGGIDLPLAQANVNLFGGSNIGSGEQGLAVGELTGTFLVAELGPFFEWSHDSDYGGVDRYTAGMVGRVTLPVLSFFGDSRLGYGWTSTSSGASGGSGFDLEFGAGYRFGLGPVDLLPRVGIHAVSASNDLGTLNLSLGLAIPF